MPNFAGFFLSPVINSVRSSAKKHNGSCTWEFSQIKDPVASIIGKDRITEDGICEMLSAKWIECHAHDSALPNWLEGSGKAIDPSKIRQLMQLFIIGSTFGQNQILGNVGGAVDQTAATTNWLRAKGVIQRKSIKPITFMGGQKMNVANSTEGNRAAGTSKSGHAAAMASAIAMSMNTGSGSYRTIGIWGPHGGHAMAAWVGKDVAFFDPNYGEFWFENRSDFIRWWPKFFSKACYNLPRVGLFDRYQINEYAKKV